MVKENEIIFKWYLKFRKEKQKKQANKNFTKPEFYPAKKTYIFLNWRWNKAISR